MPVAEIITIGTEILLGDIVDTNSQYIARVFRDVGIDIYRISTVGDNLQRIAQSIQEAIERADIIITTGGLGPTVDDPTREAVALALGLELDFKAELWDQIQERFRRFGRLPTENNRKQAYIPRGATAIENPVGTAPAFFYQNAHFVLIVLPGVPREMEHLLQNSVLPFLRNRFDLSRVIKTRVLHTASIGESQIDNIIGDMETLTNPTVGLVAHSGQVDIRITAKATTEAEIAQLIEPIEQTLRQRLGDWIYGADQETLEDIALKRLSEKDWKLVIIEAGSNGYLIHRIGRIKNAFVSGQVLGVVPSPERMVSILEEYRQSQNVQVGLGVAIYPSQDKQDIHIVLITPDEKHHINRTYGGPPEYVSHWAFYQCLDIIRNIRSR